MLLTVYYMAATWLQSWRLSSMRTKIVQLRKDRGSLLLFKSQESASQQDAGLQIQAVNSTYCSNSRDARIGDLLCYSGNKHGVSLFPQLILDTSNWIGVPDKKTLFPIELSGSTIEDLSQENTIHVVIEADFSTFSKQSYASHCQIEEFGVARAWLAHEALLLLLESNEEQLSKLIASYMGNTISIGPERTRQEISIKFCFNLGKSSTDTIEMLQKAIGNESMGTTQIKEWYRRFKNGCTSVEVTLVLADLH
ncbi:hypothetical protein J6590_023818 [Homalodisca vitripennis]|nr:hypothetical protein J6590_023818 [Homalodisca vitripennis]